MLERGRDCWESLIIFVFWFNFAILSLWIQILMKWWFQNGDLFRRWFRTLLAVLLLKLWCQRMSINWNLLTLEFFKFQIFCLHFLSVIWRILFLLICKLILWICLLRNQLIGFSHKELVLSACIYLLDCYDLLFIIWILPNLELDLSQRLAKCIDILWML